MLIVPRSSEIEAIIEHFNRRQGYRALAVDVTKRGYGCFTPNFVTNLQSSGKITVAPDTKAMGQLKVKDRAPPPPSVSDANEDSQPDQMNDDGVSYHNPCDVCLDYPESFGILEAVMSLELELEYIRAANF